MSRAKDTWRFTMHRVNGEETLFGFSYSPVTGTHNVTIYKADDPTRPCKLLLDQSGIPLLKRLAASLEEHSYEG